VQAKIFLWLALTTTLGGFCQLTQNKHSTAPSCCHDTLIKFSVSRAGRSALRLRLIVNPRSGQASDPLQLLQEASPRCFILNKNDQRASHRRKRYGREPVTDGLQSTAKRASTSRFSPKDLAVQEVVDSGRPPPADHVVGPAIDHPSLLLGIRSSKLTLLSPAFAPGVAGCTQGMFN